MKDLLKAELYKLSKSNTLLYLMLLLFVTNTFGIITNRLLKNYVLQGQDGLFQAGTSINAMWFGAFAGFFIASEFQNGGIRNALALGKYRTSVFMAKIFSMILCITILLFVIVLVQIIGNSIVNGYGDMPVGEFVVFFLKNFLHITIFHLSYAGFFTMFAFLTQKPGLTILLSFCYETLILVCGGFFENFKGQNLKPLLQFFPQYYYTKIDYNLSNHQFFVNGYLVCLLYFFAPVIISIFLFRKMDIK
ncbi:ABC-2 type transport system permease protein [Rhabdobacter roseus]|uniref:ABC-2 type transport system permease protein n=1 Tax=Rhabdobacter roseus TaxID=1655419 RepID=A0A840TY88_9BACT|nr:ABC transporter permease [Rhabdobacter roseus]MBB5286253.1 ABC-2 type transport system permease protein [Rhabdobacter roseus]